MASPAAVLSILVNANTGAAAAELRAIDRQAATTGKSTGRMGVLAKAGGIAAAAGIGVAVVAVKGFVKAAQDSEVSQKRMQTQLKALGISYKAHAKEIDTVIQKQSRLSGLDDEDLQNSFTNIVRVTGNVNQALKLNALAADIARAKHISLEAASKAVSKAAGGQAGALGRLGVVVNKGATGQEALTAAQKKFSGQAEAYGKTAAGAQERFGVAVENLQEKLGNALLPIVTKVAVAISDFVDGITNGTGAGGKFASIVSGIAKVLYDVGKVIFDVAKAIVEFGIDVTNVAIDIGKAVADIVSFFVDLPGNIVAAVKKGVDDILGVGKWIVDQVLAGIKGVLTFAGDVGGWIKNRVKEGIEGFKDGLIGVGSWIINRIADGIKTVTDTLGSVGGWLKNRIFDSLDAVKDSIVGVGGWVLNRLLDGFKTITDTLTGIGGWLKNRIIESLDAVKDDVIGIGATIVARIVSGIKGSIEAIKGAAKWLKDKVVDAVKDFFGISSPSKVMMELGGHLASGLIKGVVGGDIMGFIKSHLGGVASLAKGALGNIISLPGKAVSGAVGAIGNVVGGGGGGLSMLEEIAQKAGLAITSTTGGQHVPGSLHYAGRAFDTAGSADKMMAFARAMLSIAPKLAELFYDPLGVYVKNGKVIPGAIGGHMDHVHVALAKGGVVTRPTTALIGEAGPEAVIPLNGRHGFGGGVSIVFQPGAISGFIGDEEQLADKLVGHINRKIERQGYAFLPQTN